MKLIQTKEYLLLVDEEAEIKKGSYFLLGDKHINIYKGENEIRYKTHLSQSIIAYFPLTKDSKELDLLLLPNPYNILESKKFKDAQEYALSKNQTNIGCLTKTKVAWLDGYEAAQSKQFSVEDMQKALTDFACEAGSTDGNIDITSPASTTKWILAKIQSLSTQQLPKEFEPDILYRLYDGTILREEIYSSLETELKVPFRKYFETNNNSEGKEVIQGTYKY